MWMKEGEGEGESDIRGKTQREGGREAMEYYRNVGEIGGVRAT